MNESEQKGITNYWQVIMLKSRHSDYHLCSLISYPGFHHVTRIYEENIRKKKGKSYSPTSSEAYPSTQLHIFRISQTLL